MSVPLPINKLKRGRADGKTQIGFWSSLASPIAAEVIAGSGFDWLLIDTEYGPNEVTAVLPQLQGDGRQRRQRRGQAGVDALDALAHREPRRAKAIELRYFAGLRVARANVLRRARSVLIPAERKFG